MLGNSLIKALALLLLLLISIAAVLTLAIQEEEPTGTGNTVPVTNAPRTNTTSYVSHHNTTHQNTTHQNTTHQNTTHQNTTHQNTTHQNTTHQNTTHQNTTHQNTTHQNTTNTTNTVGHVHDFKKSYYNEGDQGHSTILTCKTCGYSQKQDYIEPHVYVGGSNICECGYVRTGEEEPDPEPHEGRRIVSEEKTTSDSQFDEVHRNGRVKAGYIRSKSGNSSRIVVFFPGSGENRSSVTGHNNPLSKTKTAYEFDVLILQYTSNSYYQDSSNISNSIKFVQEFADGQAEIILVGYSLGGYGALLGTEELKTRYPNARARVKLLDGYVSDYAGKTSDRVKKILRNGIPLTLYSSGQSSSAIAARGDNADHDAFYRAGNYSYISLRNDNNYNTHGKLQNLLREIVNGSR